MRPKRKDLDMGDSKDSFDFTHEHTGCCSVCVAFLVTVHL